jgi:hypothetical protein
MTVSKSKDLIEFRMVVARNPDGGWGNQAPIEVANWRNSPRYHYMTETLKKTALVNR